MVLVLLDTVRADRMSLLGYPIATTPHLDALQHAVVFEQNQANCSWTRPSMGSILTGQMPRTLGLYEEEFDRLPADAELLSQRLQQHGYTTLGVTSNPNLNAVFGFEKGFTAYSNAGVRFGWMEGEQPVMRGGRPLDDATDVTDRALALVDRHAGDAPLYLQVVYIDPHWPYQQPQAHLDAVKGSAQPGYDGGIHYIDAELDRLLVGLKARGHDDVLVVLTSDHGEGLADHPDIPASAQHGNTLYDSVLHVPLLFQHPSLNARRTAAPVENLDVARTILDLVGAPGQGFGGRTLADTIRSGAPVPEHPAIFAETDFRVFDKVAVRSPTHTLILNRDAARLRRGEHEGKALPGFARQHLEALPDVEVYPRGAVEGPSTRVPEPAPPGLREALDRWIETTPARAPQARSPQDGWTGSDGTWHPYASAQSEPIDEGTENALKALGYLDP